MNEPPSLIDIAFYEESDSENSLLQIYSEVYPSYREGDSIWLEVQVLNAKYKDAKPLQLKRFTITKIEHSAGIQYMLQHIYTRLGIEITVKEQKK